MFEAEREKFFPLELPGGIILRAVGFETYGLERRTLFKKVFPKWGKAKRYHGEIKSHLEGVTFQTTSSGRGTQTCEFGTMKPALEQPDLQLPTLKYHRNIAH